MTLQIPSESYAPATMPRWDITTSEPAINEEEVTNSILKANI